MKTQIIPTEKEVKEIDWSKPQLVESDRLLIATTGQIGFDTDHCKQVFHGMVIKGDGHTKPLTFRKDWFCEAFTPITEPITIKFMPE